MSRAGRIFALILLVLIAVLIVLLFIFRNIPTAAVTALLGVLLGGAIAGFTQYWIAELDRSQQLRLAALDRRLEAHQQAYTLWRKLLFADYKTDELSNVVAECQDWWEANCVFLTGEAREAFLKAYLSAPAHAQLLATHADSKQLKEVYSDVSRAGEIILEGVNLPSISEYEDKRVNDR